MPLTLPGADVGDQIGEIRIQVDDERHVAFNEIDGQAMILLLFRGQW